MQARWPRWPLPIPAGPDPAERDTRERETRLQLRAAGTLHLSDVAPCLRTAVSALSADGDILPLARAWDTVATLISIQ